jgi:hypothetical protein
VMRIRTGENRQSCGLVKRRTAGRLSSILRSRVSWAACDPRYSR